MGRKSKPGGPGGDDGPESSAPAPSMGMANGLAGMMAANPMLAGNPFLMAAMMNNPLLAAGRPQGGTAAQSEPPISTMIDPDVQELCDYFHIEERHARRLSDIMKNRQKTFVEDMERLYDVLERANSPAGLLVVKMREMEEGTFVGKVTADKELAALSKKHRLDDQAESKLADILARYDEERRREYLVEIERHLEVSSRPSAMAMMLLRKLGEGQPLGRPGPPAPGSYIDKQQREQRGGSDRGSGGDRGGGRDRDRSRDRRGGDRDRDRDRRGDRDRDKDRDRDRDRDGSRRGGGE